MHRLPARNLRTDAGRYVRPVKRMEGRVVVGVEADKVELQTWGRAAALRRQELSEWIKRSLNETAIRDEERRSGARRFVDSVRGFGLR